TATLVSVPSILPLCGSRTLPRPTLLPYTTLFRSREPRERRHVERYGGEEHSRRRVREEGGGDDRRQVDAAEQGDRSVHAEPPDRSEEHTSELQSREKVVCRLLLAKKKNHQGD